MRILYLHGLYSRPGGRKPTFLQELGHEVINPGMPDGDFDESVRIAQHAYDSGRPEAVVGSSRGGAVAMNIASGDTPLLLIAPAWRRWGRISKVKAATKILHSRGDAVIPFDDSVALIAESGLDPTALREVGIDHNMIDDEAFAALQEELEKLGARG